MIPLSCYLATLIIIIIYNMNPNFPSVPARYLTGDKIICIDKTNKTMFLNFGEIKVLPTKQLPYYGVEFDKPIKLVKKLS